MINLYADYYLDSDSNNFILIEWTGKTATDKKTGKESNVYKSQKFYSSLSALIEGLYKTLVSKGISSCSDLEDLKGVIVTARNVIEIINHKLTLEGNNHE